MTNIIISIIAICIAISSFALTLFNLKRDKAEIEFFYDILNNKVRIVFINVGRRTTCIKRIGYLDWSTGKYVGSRGPDLEIILKEGEFGYYDMEIANERFWEIKSFFIEDYFGRIWENSEKDMTLFYEMTYDTIFERLSKESYEETAKDSLKSYLAFLDKNKYTNENERIRKFRDTGEL